MKKILDILVDKFDRKLTQERQAHPYDESVGGWFMFGKAYKVEYYVNKDTCEVIVSNVPKDTYLENVSLYCESHCLDWDDIDIDLEVYDFWNDHGFANEADYMRYRYG